MELLKYVPLYYVAMLQSMVIVTEISVITSLAHIVVTMRSRPQTLKETQLVSVHTEMPREVDMIFVGQSLDLGIGSLERQRPPRPSRYFGLPMMNPSRPSLPPNRSYRQPLDYPEYGKDFDPDAHVRVFKATIKANGETKDAKIINLFSFTFKDIVFDWCNNYMGDYLDCTSMEL